MAKKPTKKEVLELPPLERIVHEGYKFMTFRDDGFVAEPHELEGVVGAMVATLSNYAAPSAAAPPPDEQDAPDDVIEDNSDEDAGDSDADVSDEDGWEDGEDDDDRDAPKKGRKVDLLATPQKFRDVGRSIGTHSLKLANTRVKTHLLRIPGHDALPFPDSKLIPIVKLIFRPITVRGGNAPTSIFAEVAKVSEGGPPGPLYTAARKVIGGDLIDALMEGLLEDRDIPYLHERGIPVVFVPAPEGGDLQITPVAPAASYAAALEVRRSYDVPHETEDGRIVKRSRRGAFSRLHLSGNPQNISAMIGSLGGRFRMHARFPDIMASSRAAVWRYAASGGASRFPTLYNPVVEGMLLRLGSFTKALDDAGARPELVTATRNIATALAGIAADHALDVLEEARRLDAGFVPKPVALGPILADVVRGEGDEARRARTALMEAFAHKTPRACFDAAQKALDLRIEEIRASCGTDSQDPSIMVVDGEDVGC